MGEQRVEIPKRAPLAGEGWRPIQPSLVVEPPPSRREEAGPSGLDRGVEKTVELLRANGIETCQSCEGGPGHCYPEPTIEFYGGPEAGWRAVSLCLTYGLPIESLRRAWDFLDGYEPTGPTWAIVFSQRPG